MPALFDTSPRKSFLFNEVISFTTQIILPIIRKPIINNPAVLWASWAESRGGLDMEI